MSGSAPPRTADTWRWAWLDLRLVPAAGTVWVVELGAPWLSARQLLIIAAGAAGLAWTVRGRRPAGALVAAVLAAVTVAALPAAARAAARQDSPLRAAADQHRSVEVTLTVDGEPTPVAGPGPGRLLLEAVVTQLQDATVRAAVHDRVLVFAPTADWQLVSPGATVRAGAVLAPARPGEELVAVLSARGPPTVVTAPGWFHRAAAHVREGLARSSARILDDGPAGLLPGLVVGDTRAMDPVLADDFRRSGLTHLTAVSGANVAIVIAGVLWPLRRRAVDRRVQAAVGAAALAGFVVLAGPGASVLRAAVMGAVSLVALASGRVRAAVPALGAAVLGLLLLEPRLATDAGFALSVAATAAIVLLAPRWSRALRARRVPTPVADALAVSAAAGLATAPLIAAIAGQLPLVSLPANLLAAPAVGPATVLGLAAALAGAVVPRLGDGLVWLAGWPARWLVAVAERAAAVPDAALRWPAGLGPALLLGLAVVALLGVLWRWPRMRLPALAALVGTVAVGWPVRRLTTGWPPPDTVVAACDVGQGDALVVPTGPGAALLIDTGPDVGLINDCLRRLGISTLSMVLLSHLDADHAGALAGAVAGRSVAVVATGPLSPSDTRVGQVDRLAARSGARREQVQAGERLTVGGADVEVLAPPPELAVPTAQANDLSVLARVTVHGVRVLFTGDLSAEAESRILDRGVDVRADVLKVPHHGSADADPRFLAATGARVALISVGAHNDYGHPAARTLTWLAQDGMWIHRTDREGDLAVAGTAGHWGVAWRKGAPQASASGSTGDGTSTAAVRSDPGTAVRRRKSRYPVTPCGSGSHTSLTHLPAARRRGGGGAPALARRRGGAGGGPRPPPRRRGA